MMENSLQITWNNSTRNIAVTEPTESAVWKSIAQCLPEIPIPNLVKINAGNYGNAIMQVTARGKYKRDGTIFSSMYVKVTNHISGLKPSVYPEAYLTCVNPESNNYKMYHFMPVEGENEISSRFDVEFGRIGSAEGEAFGLKKIQEPYDSYLYWIRYYEKLSKGYRDVSGIMLDRTAKLRRSANSVSSVPVTQASIDLYKLLISYAKQHVQETLVYGDKVTAKQITESKKLWRMLGERKTVAGFNKRLLELLSICPRKCFHVEDLLAKTTDDFAGIIAREEDLIKAMEAVYASESDPEAAKNFSSSFDRYNIEVYDATEEQIEHVKSHLGQLKDQVSHVYRIIPRVQKARFDTYVKEHGIHDVKELWHGSKNCNWASIVENGLLLNPNAQITGKMLGNGIYFANSSMKSWNYTSYHGTYWANGQDDIGIMGLYAVAYGNPLHVTTEIRSYEKDELQKQKYDCVHAHGGYYLRADEIVFYDEAAVCLNYLVIFK